jgi:TatD DNase family protein
VSRKAERDGDPVPAPQPLAVPVVDAHCHLDLMDGDLEANVALAQSVGIRAVVTIGVDLESSRWSAAAAAAHPDVWAAVAIHPNEVARTGADAATLAEIERLAALPQVRAVGETGLDFFRTEASEGHVAQEASFRAHIAIAKAAGKALVIHDREAHADVLRVLREEGAPQTTIIHAFSGDAEFARECADAGYLMSFAGNVTFKNAGSLREAAAVIPGDLLLVETDSPFLTPMPYRGRPNGPHLVPLTMRVLADVRGESVDQTCAAVAANARRAFAF